MGDPDRLVSRDGYDRAHPEERRQSVLDAATHSPADASVDEARRTIRDRLDAHGLPEVMVQEAGADGPAQHVEWRTADHDGRTLVNVANYSRDTRELEVLQDGTPVADVPDRIHTETLDGESWEIPGLRTRLLALE
jgi:hypothetical protein